MTTMSSSSAAGVPIALSDLARRHPSATRRLTAAHAALIRGTRGSVAARWFGAPIVLLETVGRRTGCRRSTALVYVPDGDDLVVVASNAGADRAPAWWLNLQAAGEGIAIRGRHRRAVAATVVEGARRDRLWRRFAAVSPVERYQRQCARRLPVVALRPVPATTLRAAGEPARMTSGWLPPLSLVG
jgi:deazaflavin-dependent oxidoreductase (nitroreductase family)